MSGYQVVDEDGYTVVVDRPETTVVIDHVGPPGLTGPSATPAGGTGSVTYAQNTPSASWNIVHNKNKYPGVTVVINSEIVIADVEYVDLNTVHVTLAEAASGLAILS